MSTAAMVVIDDTTQGIETEAGGEEEEGVGGFLVRCAT